MRWFVICGQFVSAIIIGHEAVSLVYILINVRVSIQYWLRHQPCFLGFSPSSSTYLGMSAEPIYSSIHISKPAAQ